MNDAGSLQPLIQYLRDLGWEDVYRRTPPKAESEAPPPAPPGGTSPRLSATGAPEASGAPAGAAPANVAPAGVMRGAATADAAEGRRAALAALAHEVERCFACTLCQRRTRTVFGSGHWDADLMLIGEGPGEQEDLQGLPFVGPAGALLTKILAAIQLSRDQVFIANVVKCRPPGNREPLPDEVQACHGFLMRQVELVRPRLIVALGRVAAQTLLETDQGIGKLRGVWHRVSGIETRVTYHPSALLRNATYKRPTWEDMQIVRDRLRELAVAPKP